MKAIFIAATMLVYSALATPDCYDYSVTKQKRDYMEVLPLMMYFNQVDWLTIQANSNCGVYTYGDVFFKSYSPAVTGVYFVYTKGTNLQCTLDNTLQTFNSDTWLYSNSVLADQTICGYYVGVANSGTGTGMFSLIRTNAVYLKWSITLVATIFSFVLLN